MKKTSILVLICAYMLSIGCSQYKNKDSSKSNKELVNAILKETKVQQNDDNRYMYFYKDLNNDNKDETIAYLWGPDFGNIKEGTMFIFKENDNKYKLISQTNLVNVPIVISEHKTNGYNDIIVNISGDGIENQYNTILKFKDNKYPLNARTQPNIDIKKIKSKSTISAKITLDGGFELKK